MEDGLSGWRGYYYYTVSVFISPSSLSTNGVIGLVARVDTRSSNARYHAACARGKQASSWRVTYVYIYTERSRDRTFVSDECRRWDRVKIRLSCRIVTGAPVSRPVGF